MPAKTVVITCTATSSSVCPGDPNGVPAAGKTDYYLFKHGAYPNDRYATDGKYPNMGGDRAEPLRARARTSTRPRAIPIVLMQFKGKGNKVFKQVTKNEAVRGAIQQTPQHFAIVLDNQIRSFPQIDYNQNPHGHRPDR